MQFRQSQTSFHYEIIEIEITIIYHFDMINNLAKQKDILF